MLAQVLAIIIFLAMFLLIILEIWERQWITLACGLLTLLLVFGLGMHSMGAIMRTLNLQSFFTTGFWYAAGESSEASSGINWQTIIFIAGMMIMVEGMAKVGFFRWLCMEIAKMVKYQVIPIFMTFMLLSFVLAMFIDSITVILFLAAVTIELSQLLEFDPGSDDLIGNLLVPISEDRQRCAEIRQTLSLVHPLDILSPTLLPIPV